MTYEEVKDGITKLINNPDTAQADAIELLKGIEADYTGMDNLRARSETDAERIRTLQDTNARLFLSQVEKPTEEAPDIDIEDGEEYIDNFFDNLGGRKDE